jgi:uncharacterized protein (TIGR02246 family)
MNRPKILLALTIVAVFNAKSALAQSPKEVVQSGLDAYVAGCKKADARALGAAYAVDSEFIPPSGNIFEGPDAISAFYTAAFTRGYAGSQGQALISEARAITTDVVLARGLWSITGATGASGPRPPECGTFSLLMRRSHDRWLVVFLQEVAGKCPAAP